MVSKPQSPPLSRSQIRKNIRNARKNLSKAEQEQAAKKIKVNFFQHKNPPKNARIGLYLSNDGELDTSNLIQSLRKENHRIFLPIIHPFNGTSLLFQRYEENSPMTQNRYAILEPKLNCSHICPLYELDYLLMPLVAFDKSGNRLGMGGGYYDKTLARYYREHMQKPELIGLAHDCQQVELLPTEAWDVPLQQIITPRQFYQW
ncbi:5-formyltetrahydrofolate cyclo-ligase [Pseudoalteromonas holothuriae]|uniref:5-formyltetrahydrofolate cyclo-ligase n=1 Tax=Pseudoalteromonas holothuriae TaxID=2963714 RepID=A0A9W4QWJ4_9GAMM|nr:MULTISPECIES: 5-formyltetrahydrofolate cyclo-ligase [unclassified Pseudoalteromonas]CAH9053106.1 5-formyltetrahydrofolate cyclo-ligase [Pseudoalteromonas sp. CIP111951]CAH9056422.1 5-formyltetrahydrofolate cyclo-ligase [Pseudoalteromonas sp. CIP111854]